MTATPVFTWSEANQRYLTLKLARIRSLLQGHTQVDSASVSPENEAELRTLTETMPAAPALETLASVFGLSPFEQDVLLLCAGVELDARFTEGLSPQTTPNFSLALAALPGAHWNALTPAAPLRRWRLVETGGGAGATLTQGALRIDEAILHYLTGAGYTDDRLTDYIEFAPPADGLVTSQQSIADRIASAWSRAPRGALLPVIQLFGPDAAARQAVAASAASALGLHLGVMRADAIPSSPADVGALLRLWERQAILNNQVLMINYDGGDAAHAGRWVESARFPLILSARERVQVIGRQLLSFEVGRPTPAEQRELWRQALGLAAAPLNGRLEALTGHFDLNAQTIQAISAGVLQDREHSSDELGVALWQACRVQSHPRLGELAQHIQPKAGWEDIVLPEAQTRTLREIAIHVRQRMKVYETWGFAAKSARGLGISALFAGVSGTGKTMAAEVLANELQLDLYHIDLSQVVSKYIGETEKNLRRVFDAAEEGGAILLFDEADALFGKRSEVKDSHDRYANVEVSYLLQRMEAYRGLAILTTNLKEAIDTAFMRRIRFAIQFPFPDAAQRAEIWRRIFPAQMPVERLDIERLARLSVAGGNIRNIALYAAFLAADAGEPVHMSNLLRAARVEYAKLEKPLSEAEIGGWA